MAISFACPQCGKKLKAPESAVGKSSKCPGCGGAVTCPEPIYEAELLESPGQLDPYGDLESDKPYAVTGAARDTAPSDDTRRPCPMCGEMIIATAAKCRFCGEVFDPTIKKIKKKGKGGKGKMRDIASFQRTMIICIFLQIIFYILLLATGPNGRPGAGSPGPLWFVLFVVWIGIGIIATVYAFKLAIRINGTGMGVVLGLLTFIPCVNLIILMMINNSATTLLRDKGHHVGFLGADMSEF